ncbi:MAG: PASTA domain-containing protein [Bacteroidetes bacterium]|nr:PASTA domain-containing protein [Bacteroidota bacterium]
MFKFITSKPLWVNILTAMIILLLVLLIFLGSLDLMTRHGKTLKIPAVTGMSFDDAKKTLESQGFDVQVQDSTFNDTVPPLRVVKQFPDADNLVKVNRTVYLTINRAVAPFVEMPNLVNMTIRNASMVLEHYGLKIGDTVFKPDFAKNSVLEQMYNDEEIKPGTKIQQGSKITLVLGNGIGGFEFTVPNLIGLTFHEAKLRLDSSRLILGALVPDNDVTDADNAFVYRQSPPTYDEEFKPNHIHQGQTIDLWLSVKKPERSTDTLKVQ